MFNLQDKTALVTGASGGIGGAIAKAFKNQGAQIVISGTRVEALESLADEIGDDIKVVPADLSSSDKIKQLFKDAVDAVGTIDILINNAGLTKDNLALRLKDEDWQSVLDVNLTASFMLSRLVLRGMLKARWGRIINITSIVGVTGNSGQANYAASKAGIIGMSKSVAQEVASRGVTVNCIAPGFIKTAMTEALGEEQSDKLNASIPAGRMGAVADIAHACVYLASEEASYVTGQTLHVNGGMAMI